MPILWTSKFDHIVNSIWNWSTEDRRGRVLRWYLDTNFVFVSANNAIFIFSDRGVSSSDLFIVQIKFWNIFRIEWKKKLLQYMCELEFFIKSTTLTLIFLWWKRGPCVCIWRGLEDEDEWYRIPWFNRIDNYKWELNKKGIDGGMVINVRQIE